MLTSKDIRVAAEMPFPEIVADDDFEAARSAAGLIVLTTESASYFRLDPKHIEEFRTYLYAMQAGRSFVAR